MKNLEIGIVGLGKFGFSLGSTLMDLGHFVVGLDRDEHKVLHAQDVFSQVYHGDATDINVLKQLRFHDFAAVAVSVGNSMEASILTAFNLQELHTPKIIVKAISIEHRKVLDRLGLHTVVQPEVDVAIATAHRLVNPGLLDLLPMSGGIVVQEFTVDNWTGKNLRQINMTNTHNVMVVAVKQEGDDELHFVPDPTKPFAKGDKMLVIGKKDAVLSLKA